MWIRVIHVMLTSKKDVSAHQICPTMGFCSYRTAWHMCHRVRAGLADEKFHKLIGIVEVDEIYVGGKTKISIGASPVPILAAKDLAKPS